MLFKVLCHIICHVFGSQPVQIVKGPVLLLVARATAVTREGGEHIIGLLILRRVSGGVVIGISCGRSLAEECTRVNKPNLWVGLIRIHPLATPLTTPTHQIDEALCHGVHRPLCICQVHTIDAGVVPRGSDGGGVELLDELYVGGVTHCTVIVLHQSLRELHVTICKVSIASEA